MEGSCLSVSSMPSFFPLFYSPNRHSSRLVCPFTYLYPRLERIAPWFRLVSSRELDKSTINNDSTNLRLREPNLFGNSHYAMDSMRTSFGGLIRFSRTSNAFWSRPPSLPPPFVSSRIELRILLSLVSLLNTWKRRPSPYAFIEFEDARDAEVSSGEIVAIFFL